MPSDFATASAVVRPSPVTITTRSPSARSARDRLRGGRLHGVGHGEEPRGSAVDRDEHHGPALGRERVGPRRERRPRRPRAPARSAALPERHRATLDLADDALARQRPGRPVRLGEREAARACAAATMAAASGCSLPRSSAAASRSSSSSVAGRERLDRASAGFPSVSVPVLSTRSVSTCSSRSSASAFLTSTPAVAPRPVPTMMAIGVASPSAQGQAMMSTATAFTRACARRGSGPTSAQTQRRRAAAAATTAGTNQPDDHVREPLDGRAAALRVRHHPDDLGEEGVLARPAPRAGRGCRSRSRVAPVTRSPARFSTGTARPSPSTRRRRTRPTRPRRPPAPSRRAGPGGDRPAAPPRARRPPRCRPAPAAARVFGASPSSARIAPDTRLRARSSSTWPSSTSSTMTAADSK